MTRPARTWSLLSLLLLSIAGLYWMARGFTGPGASCPGELPGSVVRAEPGARRLDDAGHGVFEPNAGERVAPVPEGAGSDTAPRDEGEGTGVLRVRLLGLDGSEEPEFVRLFLNGAHEQDPIVANREPASGAWGRIFRDLPLDRDWVLWVEPRHVGARPLSVAGPDRDHPEREVVVRLGEHFPRYVVRLLDEQGVPLADRQLEVLHLRSSPSVGTSGFGGRSATDGEGRIEHWGSATDPGSARWFLHLQLEAEQDPQGRAWSGVVPLPQDPTPGLHDLGDVVLEADAPEARLAWGRVLDTRGNPVAGASVRLWYESDGGRGTVNGLDGANSDADGRFAIRGRTSDPPVARSLERATRLVLRAHHDPHGAAGRAIQLGDEVELVLDPMGTVAGRVLPLEGVDLARFLVVLDPEPGRGALDVDLREGEQVDVAADGTFRVTGRPAGVYALHVHSDSSWGEVLRLDGLVVPSGGPCADPRLDGIDLGPHLVRARLTILDAEGAPVADGRWGTTSVGNTPLRANDRYVGATPELLLGGEAVAVTLVPDGHGPVHLPSVHGDTTVRLAARRPLTLRLHVEGRLDDPGLHLRPLLGDGRLGWSSSFESEDVLGEGEVLRFPAVSPGTFGLGWRATRRPLGSTHEEEVPHTPRIDVVVPPGEGPYEVELTLRAEDLLGLR